MRTLIATPILFILIFANVLISAIGSARAEPVDSTELYRRAVIEMNDLKVPAFMTYRVEATGAGVGVKIVTEPCTYLKVNFQTNSVNWTVSGRTSDHLAQIIDVDGERNVIDFDPTWAETFLELRSAPLRDRRDICAPPPLGPPDKATTASKLDPALKQIGTVLTIGPGIYRADDRGAAVCENGDPGHALHLTSRTNDPHQELTDVVVDGRSMRFCMVRFGARLGVGVAFDVTYEQHFADVGGYWIQTGGSIEAAKRIGFSSKHGIWRYRLVDMQFPSSLPLETFSPPPNDASAYEHPQRLVDIGGRRLNLYCTGTGLPTVVLEAGGGESSLDWRFVQPLLTKTTRVCSYDRAGLGFSDRGPLPRDAAAAVSDLHALVELGAIRKPFVLVGYSNGELYSRFVRR